MGHRDTAKTRERDAKYHAMLNHLKKEDRPGAGGSDTNSRDAQIQGNVPGENAEALAAYYKFSKSWNTANRIQGREGEAA